MAPAVPKVEQLVVEVACRFAGQSGVVAIGPGPAVFAMANGAGLRALGHAVLKRGCLGRQRKKPGQQEEGEQTHE